MKARLRAAAREWPHALLGFIGGWAWAPPGLPVAVRIEITSLCVCVAAWIFAFRCEQAHRRLLEQRIRELKTAADARPKAPAPTTDFVVPRQYWPN